MIMSGKLIKALQEGGDYNFVIQSGERWNDEKMAFVGQHQEPVVREEIKNLEKDAILDEKLQKEISRFMRRHHVIEIQKDGETVWKQDPRVDVILNTKKRK